MPQPHSLPPVFADVVVPRRLATAFTYVIPDRLRGRVQVGSRVRVPLGPSSVQGLIVALSQTAQWAGRRSARGAARPAFREIAELLDDQPDREADRRLLDLAKEVSAYYLAPLGQCLRLILPPARPSRGATSPASEPLESPPAPPAAPAITLGGELMLTPDERPAWWTEFMAAATGPAHKAFLWVAPFSRRRRGLLDAVSAVRAQQRSMLILAPDLARARLLWSDVEARWPGEAVLLHGGLKSAEHANAWQRIRSGEIRLVVGTRSSVFAPLARVGLIWLDDEQEELFKEEQAPHYHAREVAWMRARQEPCALILGSAGPTLETWRTFAQTTAAPLPLSPTPAPRPLVQVVDLRGYPMGTLLTDPLIAAIRDNLAARSGVLLFVNRKGFASALLCRECGQALSCEGCRVPLTYFRQTSRLHCRYCGLTTAPPDTCPSCQSTKLEPIGAGTERLEDHMRRLFPEAKLARLDREAARTSSRTDAVRRLFELGELDLLIGTKLLFMGAPLSRVGLVGIVYADALLHRPDFRAAERTFHALSQAIETAASGREPARVIVQTALPQHHAYAALETGDLARFYDQELVFRQALAYPPFARVIGLSVSSPQERAAQEMAEHWADQIRQLQLKQESLRSLTVLGPMPGAPPFLRKRYRWQIVVKAEQGEAASAAVRLSLEQLEKHRKKSRLKLDVTVDPLEL